MTEPNPWIVRLERALALLAERLDAPPSLEELAAAASISPFHFHRIWRAMIGETVGQTIARLRIAASQQRLRDGTGNVTDVAMEGGFGTSQSFARAFRRIAGVSPSDFLASDRTSLGVEPPFADVRIELRPECRLVAMRRQGGAYVELNALFWSVFNWAEANGALDRMEGIYGIPLDDPISVVEPELRYDAAFALGETEAEPPFHNVVLAAGDHVCLRHHGSYDGLEEANQALVRWLLASDREPAATPLYHHFLNDPDETPEADLVTDILILLEPAR